MAGRREQVLRAAIEVLGAEGSRRLTYQAVDTAAGVPSGTTSNYFRNRVALIDGIVDHLQALERRDWEAFAREADPADVHELAEALARFLTYATGPERARTAARYALFLESASRPELRAPLTRGRQTVLAWGSEWIRRFGSPTPERHCEILLDYLDGAALHQLAFPADDFDPLPGIRDLLRGLLA
ncbi:TetR/AcrR family transcriptional regulator [Streptomyces sp. MST-110588]|uniref:TetR/AcrR family transcriptional regulator n=1 Tax=Streptomyces sp. MST-110588 TaxID=2833628 RepID=UPI001F5DD8C2|nr:TetR/AcrR family transcriptional regulator [Streptomyces sp. MST-110588]UNO39338.1 TetR family transcriptional regulator [Streptomyces sp. MST-110588]